MGEIDLGDLGSVEVSKKLKAQLNISADELFERFPELAQNLSRDAIQNIKDAIDNNDTPKLKKTEDEIYKFFEGIQKLGGKFGVGRDEIGELEKISELEKETEDESPIEYDDKNIDTEEIETYDKDTGLEEGSLILDDGNREGRVVPVSIREKICLKLEHNGEINESEGAETEGRFSIENVSSKDRLWDINVELANIERTDLEDKYIYFKELAANTSEEISYSLNMEQLEPFVEVKEFISTLNDPEIESYSLALGSENNIYCGITLRNTTDKSLMNLVLEKEIPEGFENVEIISTSVGEAEKQQDEINKVIWRLEALEPDKEEKLELKMSINVDDVETKVRSGKIDVKYVADKKTLSGVNIERVSAYTNNAVYIEYYELDEEPDKYECKFNFENKSEYKVRLVNADVYDKYDQSIKYVDIDPEEVPELAAGAKWVSKPWTYKVKEEGADPEFITKVEFFVLSDHKVQTSGSLNINDLELAVAGIEGTLQYDVSTIPSFKVSEFHAQHEVKNSGGADLNEIVLEETIQTGYIPPDRENILVYLNEDEISLDLDTIIIEPDDKDASVEHKVRIELKDLREKDIGAFKPGDTIKVTYPIVANKPRIEDKYVANALYSANTYPPGKAIEITPYTEPIEIEVVHIRKRYIKGKEINALATEGEYEITLYVINTGKFALENFTLEDKVPADFEYSNLTLDPIDTREDENGHILKWKIDRIEPDNRYEIKYKLSGEGKPSEAQQFR
ncbi:MAG: hypothetical protein ACTSU2_13450 [Promethearchaeota archaeon]